MRHHIECSQSRSRFNNNRSHYFQQFLLVTHRLKGRILPKREHFPYIPPPPPSPPIITSIMQCSQTWKLLPVFLFIYPLTPLPGGKKFFSFISVQFLTQICFGFLKKNMCFFPWFLTGIPLILFLSQPRS